MYAMKYMNKNQCIQEGAVANILQELRLLRNINHPYIVNLRWVTRLALQFHKPFEELTLNQDYNSSGYSYLKR